MDPKEVLDMMIDMWRKERSLTQMTLGKLIEALRVMQVGTHVANLNYPHSYRGYYEDLAFELGEGTRPVEDLLADCNRAMHMKFTGYKGGGYHMNEDTPVWIAEYGCCGKKLMGIHAGGGLDTAENE